MKISDFLLVPLLLFAFSLFATPDPFPEKAAQPGLFFTQNKGQIVHTDGTLAPEVLFQARANGMDVCLTTSGISYVFSWDEAAGEGSATHSGHAGGDEKNGRATADVPRQNQYRMDMELLNANLQSIAITEEPAGFYHKYYLAHCPEGVGNAEAFRKITFQNVYPNIDWVIYSDASNPAGFKYDFVVHPGGDPNQIKLSYSGFTDLQLTHEQSIEVYSPVGKVSEGTPYAYMEHSKASIDCRYQLTKNVASFAMEGYDNANTLVIDPALTWSTYFGSSASDGGESVVVDSQDSVIVVGWSKGFTFPTTSGTTIFSNGNFDIVVSKFSNFGVLGWSALVGGSIQDYGKKVDVDPSNNIYVIAETSSWNFPTLNAHNSQDNDIAVFKMSPSGVMLWSTYFGGPNGEDPKSIAVANDNSVYICGDTQSFSGIATSGSHQPTHGCCTNYDAFLVKFNGSGVQQWATYYGGEHTEWSDDLGVDDAGNVYMTGVTRSQVDIATNGHDTIFSNGSSLSFYDNFLVKFDASGTRQWGTYVGGTGDERASGLGVDQVGNAYVVGRAGVSGVPITTGAYKAAPTSFDVFITKFNTTGGLEWGTFYGGTGTDNLNYETGVAADTTHGVAVTGTTESTNLDTLGAIVSGYKGNTDGFVAQFSPTGSLLFSTYYAGNNLNDPKGASFDHGGNIFITGLANSTGNPILDPGNGAWYNQYNPGGSGNSMFVAKFGDVISTVPNITASAVGSVLTCGNDCNGQATVTSAHGVAPITYSWGAAAGNQSTATATGLCYGTYTITVVDATNDSTTATVDISGPSPIITNVNAQAPACGLSTGGSIALSATGGNQNVAVSFDGIDDEITVSNSNSLNLTTQFSLEAWIYLKPAYGLCRIISKSGAYGFGIDDSTQMVFNTFGVQDYLQNYTFSTRQWYHVAVVLDASNDAHFYVNGSLVGSVAGTSNGNSNASPVIIGNRTGVIENWVGRLDNIRIWNTALSASTINYFYCNPIDSIHPNQANLVGDWKFSEATGTTAADASGNGRTANLLNGTAWTQNDEASYGCTADGVGYQYLWSNGATTQNIANLAAGSYTVTITDFDGCTTSDSGTVVTSAPPVTNAAVSSSYNGTDVSCNGASDGAITASPTGGILPYTYQWSTNAGGQTTATVTGLSAGSYLLTVTDSLGCEGFDTVAVTEPTVLTASASITSNFNGEAISCFGACDGVALAAASGGTAAYTYAWGVDAANQTTATATGLCFGTHLVTITDGNGCVATDAILLTSPVQLAATATVASDYNGADVSCFGQCDGDAAAAVTGGTAAYTYLWDTNAGSQTTALATGLCANSYSVTVTDANGCSNIDSLSVSEPAQLAVAPAVTSSYNGADISCKDGTNGSASAAVTGGTGAYSYTWSSGGTGSMESGLSAGTYTVSVADANGCAVNDSITLTEPDSLLSSATVTSDYNGNDISCFGASDGTISASVSGGTGAWSYSWSSGGGAAMASGLPAGSYTVAVTDANGCASQSNASISSPAALALTMSGTNHSCIQNDGTAAVAAAGGQPAYSYLWSNGNLTGTLTNLGSGTYAVTVSDANGCAMADSIVVVPATSVGGTASITSSFNGSDVSCAGASDGQATATPIGGSMPFTYMWSNAAITQVATGLSASPYTVTITDGLGCTTTASVSLNEPAALAVVANATQPNCGISDGTAIANPTGGTTAYTYLWSNGGTSSTITNLGTGQFTVTITDANGCTAAADTTLLQPAAIAGTATVTSTYSGAQISCNGATDAVILAAGQGGSGVYSYAWSSGGNAATEMGLAAGQYTVTITDSNGCTAVDSASVSEPTALLLSTSATQLTCSPTDASGAVVASGGTSGYTYLWSAGGTTFVQTGLSAGTHTVTVSDANSCSTIDSVVIAAVSLIGVTVTVSSDYNGANVSCNGTADGAVTATPTGGAGNYSYAWSTGATTAFATGLVAGTYTVTVSDSLGCSATNSNAVTEPLPMNIGQVVTQPTCAGNDGSILPFVSGGTPGFTFLWDDGTTDFARNGLASGTYFVTATDTNGCVGVDSMLLSGPVVFTTAVAVTSNFNGADISCFGATDGAATVTVTGGSGAANYAWSNGATTATASTLAAGTYTVSVTDGPCQLVSTVTLTAPAGLATTIVGTDPDCGISNGTATVSVTGGTSNYSIDWSNGSQATTAIGLGGGTHFVTVIDTNNCTIQDSISLNLALGFDADAVVTSNYNGADISCADSTDGAAEVVFNTGTGPFAFVWSSGGTNQQETGLGGGSYFVTISDTDGCTEIASVFLTEPAPLSLSLLGTDPLCNQNNGSATLVTSGGTPGYSFLWSNLEQTATINQLGTGTYVVAVTDDNLCVATDSITLVSSDGPTASISSTQNPTCSGGCDGAATADAVGGTLPIDYQWSNGDVFPTAQSLCAGTYSVTVTDAAGCTAVADTSLTALDSLTATFTITPASPGDCDGSATVTIIDGIPPFQYLWDDNANDQMTATAVELCDLSYCVHVTDSVDCKLDTCISITTGLFDLAQSGPELQVWPNPTNGLVSITVLGANADGVLRIVDVLGREVQQLQLTQGQHQVVTLEMGQEASGLYFVELSSGTTYRVERLIVNH